MPTTVSVDVYAKDRASSTFDKVGNSAHKSGGLIGSFGKTVAGVFTGAALYNGARDLVHLFGDLTQGAVDDEAATKRLALQLHNSAHATDAQVAATEDWITAQGKALGITDDDLRPALARAVTATHSVKDAQDLVSEAMDVAAGKQKSLLSVTEALSKGAQGNTGALGKLGIATKDASGKALTFDQIQKGLAETFKGQAASAADTAAGKYKIMRTQFSEMGETIGYKLLPVVNDFGDWVLNKGIPAASQFGSYLQDELSPTIHDMQHWVSENKDELKDFAKVAVEDVIGGLKVVVDVGGKVVGFFNDLPGPVKKVGVEVAVAAFAFRQFNNALSPIGRNLSTFIGQAATAEARTKALSTAARQGAGVAGLGLLIDSTQRSNDALSTLEGTAGAAATGFAVGGPWGAAIGGAGGLVYELGSKFAVADRKAQNAYDQIKAVDPVKEAEKSLADLKDSLDQVTGAYTGATRAAVLQKLQQAGLIETGQKYGLTTRQMIDGAIGQKGAFAALKPVVGGYEDQLSTLDAQIKAVKDSNESYTYGDKDTNVAFRKLTDSATSQVTALEKQKKALQTSLEELKQLPGTLKDGTKEILATSAATADYSGKLHDIPPSVKTDILTHGLEPTAQAIANLTDRYNLTPKQVKTLIQATGAETSAAQVQRLKDRIDALRDKTVIVNVRTVHSSAVAHGIGGSGGGGNDPLSNPAGRHAAGDVVAGNYFGLGNNTLAHSGAALLASLVAGITSGKVPLDKVLDKVKADVQNKLDFRANLQAMRDQLAGGFAGLQESVFSTQATDQGPVTLEQLLAKSAAERAKAASVDTDVQKLLSMGISKDLIEQFQSQGSAGVDALHALAGASADQLAQIMGDNAAAQASYAHAGQVSADKFYATQIAAADQQLAIARSVQDALTQLQAWGEKLRFELEGDTLVASMAKNKKDKGKQ